MRAVLHFLSLGTALSLLVALPSRADESPDALRASVLFAEGRSLAAQGRYAEACERFEKSLDLVYGVGTMFNLANCWEKVGRTGSALLMFRRVAATTEGTGQDDRARLAAERAMALESKVAKMQIRVAAPPKIEVKRNDEVVRNDELGAAVPVDPGTYRVVASSPGKKPWYSELNVKETGSVVVVDIPPLEDDPPDAPADSGRTTEPVSKAEPRIAPVAPVASPAGSKRLAVILAGVGGGALTAGAAFALQYKSSNDDARSVCSGTRGCTASDIHQHSEFVNDARQARTLSYLGLGIGVAAMTSAGIVYFSSRRDSAPSLEASADLTPNGAWSAGLRGKF